MKNCEGQAFGTMAPEGIAALERLKTVPLSLDEDHSAIEAVQRILEQCKGLHCVDLGESFQTHIFL